MMWDSSTRGVGDGGGPVPHDLGGQLLWVSGWLNFIINAVSRNWAPASEKSTVRLALSRNRDGFNHLW